jgi:hypothetical protein
MKNILPGVILSLILLCAACQAAEPVCPEGAGTLKYLDSIPDSDLSTQLQLPTPTPAQVEIGGKAMRVDKVVQGPLCIDTWQGVVYVTCDVQVLTWKDQPLFLKDCKLKIEPGTIVYVADHNDTAYYNGCSCHTGEEVQP